MDFAITNNLIFVQRYKKVISYQLLVVSYITISIKFEPQRRKGAKKYPNSTKVFH